MKMIDKQVYTQFETTYIEDNRRQRKLIMGMNLSL